VRSENARDVLIIGGGVTGLALALSLHQVGIVCRVYEGAPQLKWLGVGINLLPHAVRELTELGLAERLERHAVLTREMCFYNRFGQFVYKEPRGRYAGYEWPQFSIHRGDLYRVLVEAVRERLGADAITLGARCEAVEQDAEGVTVRFAGRPRMRGSVAIACDGVHSAVRRQLYPDEGPPVYTGINMWRGVTRWQPYLSGESFVQCGWLDVGKIVVYPIGKGLDAQGRQLITWTAEFRSPRNVQADWNLNGRLADFLPTFESFRFEWLDVAEMLRKAEIVLEYPMVDRDPLPRWTSAGSRSSAMRRTRCIRAARMARHRGSSTRARSPAALRASATRLPRSKRMKTRGSSPRTKSCSQVARSPPTPSCAWCTSAPATSRSGASKTW